MVRIYAPFSTAPSKPYEVLIRRTVHQGQGGDRVVTVADLIGLSLWRYNEEKLERSVPAEKANRELVDTEDGRRRRRGGRRLPPS